MKKAIAAIILLMLVVPMVFVGSVSAPTVGSSDNGILKEQWHYDMQPLYTTLMFGSSSCIADLAINNVGGEPNSDLEIIVGSDEYANNYPELGGAYAQGIWRVLDSQGNLEWAIDTGTDESRSSPTVADMTGDGYLDIVGGTTSGWNVEVIDRFGNWVWTFPWPPQRGGPFMWHSSPAVADVDPLVDGLEVFIGNNPYMDVWALDGDNSDGIDDGITATDLWIYGGVEGTHWDVLWKFTTGGIVYSSPALGDVDNDGDIEVVIGSGDNNVYILDGKTGALEWSYSTSGPVHASAAIANLDGDPYLEIVMGSGDGNIYCLEWTGTTGSVEWTYSTGSAVYSSGAIGDVDGDGALEIVDASTNGNVYCLDTSGNVEWTYPIGSYTVSSPALADRSSVSAYDRDWPMFRHDRERTGYYGPSPGSQGLDVYIGADDHYLYLIEGGGGGGSGGSLIDRFLTYGRLYTSPSVADIDGDSRLEIVLYDAEPGHNNRYTYWCIEDIGPVRTLDKRIHKKVKVIPAPVQFWREFIGGVTDIIVSDPPDWPPEGVALVREYTVLHNEGHIPLELLTWEGTEGLPWEPIDTPEEPYILLPGESAYYDIPTVETDTAVLVRYTVAWASTPNIIEAHFINEAILESKSPQVIVGQLSNFDVHNDYHEPVDNFELELYGIQPSDIVDWFPGWGTPPEINPIPPSADGTMPGGTEIIWIDPDHPVMPCEWVHFGLHLKPGVIAVGVKAYWTQVPSAELGDVIHTKIDVTVPLGETVTVVDTLPHGLSYITGTFTVDGVPATPTITKIGPPPSPPYHEISYTITASGTHLIEFDCKVDEAKSWEDTEVCNIATATWYDAAGEIIETKEDVECFIIHAFEELHKSVGVPKKVKVIPAPVQFWREFIGGVTDIIVFDPPEITEPVALVRDYVVLHDGEGPIPLELLTWEGTEGLPWEPIDTPEEPYILPPDGIVEYDIPTVETDTAVLVRYTVAWAYSPDVIEAHFINEAILESKSPQVIVGQLSNFDVHNDYPEPVDNFELELYGIQPSDVVDWFPGWGAPPQINAISGGTEIIWMDKTQPVQPCQWVHFGLHLKPGVIATGIKAYWTQLDGGLTIKEKTNVQWRLEFEVSNPFPYTMTNVEITDRLGAELEIDPPFPYSITHGTVSYYTQGTSAKVFLTWTIGNLLPGETARLIILVSTDTNPGRGDCNKDGKVDVQDAILLSYYYGTSTYPYADFDENGRIDILDALTLSTNYGATGVGKQEYTEPGIYELNSGATLKFIDPEQNMQLSAVTDSIYVTVLPLEDP